MYKLQGFVTRGPQTVRGPFESVTNFKRTAVCITVILGEISGSYGSEYEGYGILEHSAV
jgi:hypothetical protein